MAKEHAHHARFLTIYIREAHPTDEWQMESNEAEDVCYPQPRTSEQRVAIARDFAARYKFPIELVVDSIENPADAVFAGWPERLYVIDPQGRISFKGEVGPFGFDPEAVEAVLDALP
jgi:hypothetical protein